MNHKLYIALALFALSAIVFASLCQAEVGTDKYLHFGISAAFGTGLSAAMTHSDPDLPKWERRAWSFTGAMIPGVFKEYGMDAEADPADMMANITGAMFGVWLGEYLAKPSRPMTRTEDLQAIISR